MKKRFLVVMSLLMVLSLVIAGCGGGQQTQSQGGGAGTGDTIKIGANFELTGTMAAYGRTSVNAVKMAADEWNANGGLLGKQIEIVEADNKSLPDESTNAATRLVTQDKVVAIIGTSASTTTLGMVPVVQQYKIPTIATTATNPDVTVDPKSKETYKYMFRACFIDPFQGVVGANFAYNDLGAKNAVLYIDDKDAFSVGLAKFFKENFEKLGGTILSEEHYVAGDQDFRSTLTKIQSMNPDVIYEPGHYQETGMIIKQAREMGITTPVVGGDGWDSPDLVKIAGPENMNNVFMSNHFIPSDPDPKIQEFVKAYTDKFGEAPDAKAVLAYEAANIMFTGIKNANSTKGDDIVAALEGLKDYPGLTGSITFDDQHNPVKPAIIIEFKNGEQVMRGRVNP